MGDKLTEVLDAARILPQASQELLADEMRQRVIELAVPQMTDEQRAEVGRRLSGPRRYVTDEDVRAILRRYNPEL